MKKTIYTLLTIMLFAGIAYSQTVTTLWEKSSTAGTKPVWEVSNTTRGLSYGFVEGKHLLFVANRTGGNSIIYFDAATGDSLGSLNTEGISGGTLALNDVEVSQNGKIFACNLSDKGTFKVYKYDSLHLAPVNVISFTDTFRLGDKFTITGSTADNSVVIWAIGALASAGPSKLFKFTTTDNGLTFTPSELSITSVGSSAAAGPLPDGSFYTNSHGSFPIKFSSEGIAGASIPGTVISSSGSAIRYLTKIMGDDYLVANDLLTAVNNNGKILKVVGGKPASAVLYGASPILGPTNAGGLGDISFRKVSDYIYHFYPLATNNGFGAYQVDLTPTLSGTYYIGAPGTGPDGSDPVFPDLRAAFDILNSAKFSGDCIFYITSNITETYGTGVNYGLGLAVNPEPYTVTFKPYTGVQPVITLPYPGDLTSGPSGALVIGLPSKNNIAWADLKPVKNIVFDGSNTVDGTTRDLTIQNETTSHGNGMPLLLVGDVSDVTIKNCNIYYKAQSVSTSNLFRGAVIMRSRVQSGVNYSPQNIWIENNHLSSNFDGVSENVEGIGTYQGNETPVLYVDNLTIKNNLIEGKRRGIALFKAANCEVSGNEIILNQDILVASFNESILASTIKAGSVINIYNNIFSKVSSKSSGATFGNTAISIESAGTYNVYNNMITGFELTGANPVAFLRGVKVSSADATLNFYHNTILMNNLPDIGTGTVTYQGIYLINGTSTIKNNIIVNEETEVPSTCLYRSGALGTVVSDYNNLYPVSNIAGFVGYWNDGATGTLASWQTASGQDANSVSKEVFFTSATDLHLTGASNGDQSLIGTPLAEVTKDIDGDNRDAMFPYMGADEAPIVLPVELTAFEAKAVDGGIQLAWTTATEMNNSGFEVERKSASEFVKIGFVTGKGTSVLPVSYSFVDRNLEAGVYYYRLKQVDFNGTSSYSEVVEVDLSMPLAFGLNQNYPNPFNPATTIKFQIAEPVNVTLTVYNALGAEVAVLIDNQFTTPGNHTVQFNASKLASGTYIYRLTAGNFVETRKMVLMK